MMDSGSTDAMKICGVCTDSTPTVDPTKDVPQGTEQQRRLEMKRKADSKRRKKKGRKKMRQANRDMINKCRSNMSESKKEEQAARDRDRKREARSNMSEPKKEEQAARDRDRMREARSKMSRSEIVKDLEKENMIRKNVRIAILKGVKAGALDRRKYEKYLGNREILPSGHVREAAGSGWGDLVDTSDSEDESDPSSQDLSTEWSGWDDSDYEDDGPFYDGMDGSEDETGMTDIGSSQDCSSGSSTEVSSSEESNDDNCLPYCDNCMRQYIPLCEGEQEEDGVIGMHAMYGLDFHVVPSMDIRGTKSHLRQVVHNVQGESYLLCTECRNYLDSTLPLKDKEAMSWENTWPSFMWNLLSGRECGGEARWFKDVYDAEMIWQFIPDKLRLYWKGVFTDDSLVRIPDGCGGRNRVWPQFRQAFACDTRCPLFMDRSVDIENFHSDIKEMALNLLVDQLAPKPKKTLADEEGQEVVPIMLPDVLCPWGCTEFCFRAADFEFGLLVQHHLRKVQLNFPKPEWYKKMYLIETSRLDFIRLDGDYDMVLLKDEWEVRPTVAIVKGKGLCVKLCRHHGSDGTRRRLYPHPPRKPHHNLSAETGDQLCHAQIVGRIHKTIQQRAVNSQMTMHTLEASFAGISSSHVTDTPRFSRGGTMLCSHEALSMAGRPDISHLASRHVHEGTMTASLADAIREDASKMYPDIDYFLRGSTYVGMTDAMVLHMNSKNSCILAKVKRKRSNGELFEAVVNLQRSWCPLINFLQTEDPDGFGSPFSPIPFYRGINGQHTMILWALASVIAGCKELYHSIGQKIKPFHHEDWPGHMLANVHKHCAKYDDNSTPRGSPFSPNRSNGFLIKVLEKSMPEDSVWVDGTDYEDFHRHSFVYWQRLFPESDFTKVCIHQSVEDVLQLDQHECQSKEVIIVVCDSPPEETYEGSQPGEIVVGGSVYEARVITVLDKAIIPTENPSNYYAKRYMRHGGGFSEWWEQERKYGGAILTKKYCRSPNSESVFPHLIANAMSYITVYVKVESVSSEEYRLDFHKSLGGQVHLFCKCAQDPFPLIVSGARKGEKRICMKVDCTKKEHYICSQPGCGSRICKECFDEYPESSKSFVDPSVVEEEPHMTAEETVAAQVGEDEGYNGDDENDVDSNCEFDGMDNSEFDPFVDGQGNDEEEDGLDEDDWGDCSQEDGASTGHAMMDIELGDALDRDDVDLESEEEFTVYDDHESFGESIDLCNLEGELNEDRQGDDGGEAEFSCNLERELNEDRQGDDGGGAEFSGLNGSPVENEYHAIDFDMDFREGDGGNENDMSEFDDDSDSIVTVYDDFVSYGSTVDSNGLDGMDNEASSMVDETGNVTDLDNVSGEADPSDGTVLQRVHGESLRESVETLRAKIVQATESCSEHKPSLKDRLKNGVSTDHTTGGNVDCPLLQEFITTSNLNPVDVSEDSSGCLPGKLPKTSAGDYAHTVLPRKGTNTVPCHVLFNQAGSLCTRYNKKIKGTQAQQNFVQRLVSTVQGLSIPLLFLMGTCFPRHFYASAKRDRCAILGCAPLSCYTGTANPNGFASSLSIARNLGTHSSSSTSTCPLFWSFLYDIQANRVSSEYDSRLIGRRGFMVDVKSKNGISLRDESNKSNLSESVDSHQSALDLAATQHFLKFHLFLTFTCNQAEFPGIKHLYRHKESMEWTKHIPGYKDMNRSERRDVKRSFEAAYGSILGRCWMEVRKLWLEYITYSTSSILRRVTHVFFRDEYQEDSGNLSHIHGLVSLYNEDMSNKEFREFVTGLQKSAVCDLFQTSEIDRYIEEGLFESPHDWKTLTAKAQKILTHTCDRRCLKRVGPGEGPENFACRKPHTVFGKTDPIVDEMVPFRYDYSDPCLQALEKCGLWEPPTEGAPNGTFRHELLTPKRHMGSVHPSARCNMTPVIPEFFAATKSQQNVQILEGTNGVARYVVKYVVKIDKGNRCTVWADPHSGAVMRVESQFLHNTKVTGSKINEDKAHERSRKWRHPSGRAVAFPEMQQQILGYPEVMTNLRFVRICTKPFELRSSTIIQLNNDGYLKRKDQEVTGGSSSSVRGGGQNNRAPDVQEGQSPCHKARERLDLPSERRMSKNQRKLYGNNIRCGAYDKITQYSLRPVELLELVQSIGNYYRWFEIFDDTLSESEIHALLDNDVTECTWVDGLGRVVNIRKGALGELRAHLDTVSDNGLKEHSKLLKAFLIDMIDNQEYDEAFVFDDEGEDLPIPVFSSITPDHPIPFILHTMLMLGKYETELDLRMQTSLRSSLMEAGLIGRSTDSVSLEEYSDRLLKRVVEEVFFVQPVSLRRLDDFIIKAKRLLDAVIIQDAIPVHDLPPCILTDLLDSKNEELCKFWEGKRNDLLTCIYRNMPEWLKLPLQSDVQSCNKRNPLPWDPISSFEKSSNQTDSSYEEQKLAVSIANNLVRKYCNQFGEPTTTFTKGSIVHGAPGSGKSHVILYNSLIAMAKGLRVMTTALMGVRANALGGIHLHRLFGMLAKKKGNPYRLAELALDKLYRKSHLKYLHVLLTMDVLIIDECGQLSADQLSIIDIILRNLRKNDIPFGGVLVMGTMDHTQLGAIDGWPFLLSSHILTEFVLVKLSHSVRAFGDPDFQKLQNFTRMSPKQLLGDKQNEIDFKALVSKCFDFVDNWESPKITPDMQRMYAKRMPAYEASCMYVDSLRKRFLAEGTEHSISKAVNLQQTVGTRAEYSRSVTDDMKNALNHGLREPETLLFFKGAQFEATLNGDGYNQSQLLLMLDVPPQGDIAKRSEIDLMAAPPNINYLDLSGGIPTEHDLERSGWKHVRVGHAPETTVTCRGSVGCRQQYSLRHVGSSTINKQLGNTIRGKCAVECSRQCSPFCKEQVVVGLSRTCCSKDTIIVGEEDFVKKRLWELITMSNQWTEYIETMLERLSVNGDPEKIMELERYFNYADNFPYRTCDGDVPTDSTGYVYMLVSIRDFDRDYIGQTENLSRRLDQHYRGHGAEGTYDPYYHPYGLAAFICGLSHEDKRGRERLEQKWKDYNRSQIQQGNSELHYRIEQGRRLVKEYNEDCRDVENHIRLIETITREVSSS